MTVAAPGCKINCRRLSYSNGGVGLAMVVQVKF
jgi:hypothetical protein